MVDLGLIMRQKYVWAGLPRTIWESFQGMSPSIIDALTAPCGFVFHLHIFLYFAMLWCPCFSPVIYKTTTRVSTNLSAGVLLLLRFDSIEYCCIWSIDQSIICYGARPRNDLWCV